MCHAFGHGAADEISATAVRVLRGMRGDVPACKRYLQYLAIKRALKGHDLLIASFERGACASLWASAGFLFRAPTHRHITGGKRPLIVFSPVVLEPAHVLRAPKQQLYACLHYQLEQYLRAECAAGEPGHVLVFDLKEFGWRHLHRRFLTQVVKLIGVLLKNYPETVYKLAVVNAPSIFSIAWAAILPFANEHVQSKITISRGSNTDALRELVGAEVLPADLGGDAPVAGAEPGASAAPADADPYENAWTDVTIDAGKTAQHVVEIGDDEAGAGEGDASGQGSDQSIAIEFAIESSDVSFFVVHEPLGADKKKAAAEQSYALEPQSHNASAGTVSHLIEGARPGRYTCVWDNTQAWRYPRTVSYRVFAVKGAVPMSIASADPAADDDSPTAPLPEWEGLTDAEMAAMATG